jgi:diadenylate cyclase
MINAILELLQNYWNAAIEILLLAVAIYYGYLYFRGTRGAKVLTGLAILFITLTLVSQILNLTVISWLLRSLTAFLAIALVVIFQPELRRAGGTGSGRFFSSAKRKKRLTSREGGVRTGQQADRRVAGDRTRYCDQNLRRERGEY